MFLKKLFFIVLSFPLATTAETLETARTTWVPWTADHSLEWEHKEKNDPNLGLFRRNQFFESPETLIIRDNNWKTLYTRLRNQTNTPRIFPDLGFAILDKTNNNLIGIVRFKTSERPGYLKLSYGFVPEIRNKKFGNEIMQKTIELVEKHINTPIVQWKKTSTKHTFHETWFCEGKKTSPHFNDLVELFDDTPTPLKGITASVDIINYPSIALLAKYGMQAIELECTKHYLENN